MACAASPEEQPAPSSTDEDLSLQSAPVLDSDMKRIAIPAGMPKPYDQPDSTGIFDERGKCGPTALANAMRLYWIDLTPQQADAEGVHWLVGTLATQIEDWLEDHHPEMNCSIQHPKNGPAFLRTQLDGGHPVMMWFNTQDNTSHWVTAVGHRGTGAAEVLIVMSWGAYYTIPMAKMAVAWSNVYELHNPAVVCAEKTTLLR
jgi:hypothetical protein